MCPYEKRQPAWLVGGCVLQGVIGIYESLDIRLNLFIFAAKDIDTGTLLSVGTWGLS